MSICRLFESNNLLYKIQKEQQTSQQLDFAPIAQPLLTAFFSTN